GQASGLRSLLAVPMLRDGAPVGVIGIGRTEPGLFPHTQIDLLQTFADQAVIAIENVRLFKELEARNAALTEALAQQTATADILRSTSDSPTDYKQALTSLLQTSESLCGAVEDPCACSRRRRSRSSRPSPTRPSSPSRTSDCSRNSRRRTRRSRRPMRR